MPYNADGGTLTQAHLDTLKYMKYNSATNQIESSKEIQTTLNSFFLGEQHKISSGAENIFFSNLQAEVNWFPAWSGIKNQSVAANQGEEGVIPPSFRTYGPLQDIEPYGALNLWSFTPYARAAALLGNHAVFGQQFFTGEAVAADDWLVYQVWYGTDESGIQAYEQKFTGQAYAFQDPIDWWFDHPVEGHEGTPIFTTVKLRKGSEDGEESVLLVAASTLDPNIHYSNIRIREFTDSDVMAGVRFLVDDHVIGHAGTYAVDTSNKVVNITVNSDVGYKSFIVFDADKNFNTNACIVDFGAPQGTATLQSKNDSYMFYHDGTQWRFLDLNTKDGGIV